MVSTYARGLDPLRPGGQKNGPISPVTLAP